MSLQSPAISLIDLSKQLTFEIDEKIKEQICFAETLIVSCGHYEGEVEDESSESDWDSTEVDETEETESVKEVIEIKDYVAEEAHEEQDDENQNNGFYFYFFPDCNKPISPQNSKCSVVVENGMPKMNLAAIQQLNVCTCEKSRKGDCPCVFKIPCSCGATTKAECTCDQLKDICICDPLKPELKCICHKKETQVCVCEDGKMYPYCVCEDIDKPCICDPKKYPCPVCKCPRKPKPAEISAIYKKNENVYSPSVGTEDSQHVISEASFMSEGHEEQPCKCQAPDPKPVCLCTRGKECTCYSNPCICGAQRFRCVCEPSDFDKEFPGDGVVPCKDDENKSICSCDVPKICTCESEERKLCQCFPIEKPCTCSIHSDGCKCFQDCDCELPCLCDTVLPEPEECICLSPELKKNTDVTCTCPRKINNEANKLKRVRAGKHGYRWCHEVDPHHTYFDYSYGKHDKIKSKLHGSHSMFKILGLHDEVKPEVECPVHGEVPPPPPKYTKKVRKPSIDCCSAVGGMSISVETLGEDKDKFLVQVISYSSKEGAKTGTKLVSIVDCNLHTMEENRSEHITRKETTKERRSYIAIIENGYYNKVSRVCGDKDIVKRLYHTFDKAHDFLLEGANIILLRYLALQRHKGQIRTDTVLIDGKICESILVCLGVCQAVVNGIPMFVVKIERHIIEPSGRMQQTLTTLTLRGYVVSHEWADNNYILHLNPLLRIDPKKDEIEPHAPLREKWREDLQLMSDFLDFKSARTTDGGRYTVENGVLTTTIRDYLQAILLLRPQDTLHFTKHYFASVLSALDIPHDEYFNPCSKHVRYYFFED